jgi:hypothetical protein
MACASGAEATATNEKNEEAKRNDDEVHGLLDDGDGGTL